MYKGVLLKIWSSVLFCNITDNSFDFSLLSVYILQFCIVINEIFKRIKIHLTCADV